MDKGKADPITLEERAIVAELRASYEKRYGRGLNRRSDDRTDADSS